MDGMSGSPLAGAEAVACTASHENMPPAVLAAVIGVMGEIEGIAKNGYNTDGKYAFIASNDVITAIRPLLVKHKLVVFQDQVSKAIKEKNLWVDYTFHLAHADGPCIRNAVALSAACRFEFRSGSTDDKAIAKCRTTGLKSFYISFFQIPTVDASEVDDDERDATNNQGREGGDRGREGGRQHGHRDDTRNDYADGGERGRERGRDYRGNRSDDGPPAGHPVNSTPPDDGYSYGYKADPEADRAREGGRRNGRPSEQAYAEDAARNDRVMAFRKAIVETATDELEAETIWKQHKDLLKDVTDVTYRYLMSSYEERFRVLPPAL